MKRLCGNTVATSNCYAEVSKKRTRNLLLEERELSGMGNVLRRISGKVAKKLFMPCKVSKFFSAFEV